MNNDQQPPVSPDFGYIMNQQSPMEKKPGLDKRILIIVGGVLLLVVLLVLSVLVKPNKNKQTSTTGPAAQKVVEFNQALQDKDYQKATNIIASHLSESDQQELVAAYEKEEAIVDYSSCQITKVESKGDVILVDNTCLNKNHHAKITYVHTVAKSNQDYNIVASSFKSGQTL